MDDHDLLLACLCAGWCTTCDAYRATLATLAGQRPGLRLAWIDIEEHSDALGEGALDIETFPTLLLLQAGRPRFYGPVLPHLSAVQRLLQALADDALAPGSPVPAGMAQAVLALAPQQPLPD
ncbi:MAG: thioredoxin family protein [Burkholderiaceae bacterium]|nr:thioredoxin family protein [Burkholderiaceae bacterium]